LLAAFCTLLFLPSRLIPYVTQFVLPDGSAIPPLFNFSFEELAAESPELRCCLVPPHARGATDVAWMDGTGSATTSPAQMSAAATPRESVAAQFAAFGLRTDHDDGMAAALAIKQGAVLPAHATRAPMTRQP
jgi:hypothetical protein